MNWDDNKISPGHFSGQSDIQERSKTLQSIVIQTDISYFISRMGHLGLVLVLSILPIIFNNAQFAFYPNPYSTISFHPNVQPLTSSLPIANTFPLPQTYTTTFNPDIMGNR